MTESTLVRHRLVARRPVRSPAARLASFGAWVALGAVLCSSAGLAAQESPIEKAAANGRIRILTDQPATLTGPDLLVLRDGTLREAWNLGIDGDIVSFRTRDHRGVWFKQTISRTTVRRVEFGRSLQEHQAEEAARRAPEPVKVTAAEKQPVKKQNILAGSFIAKQDRYTRWSFKFASEINKYYTYAEDATEYGQFVLRSYHKRALGDGKTQENEVVAKGKYFLYAPGTMGNEDWVLNLSKVAYIENDFEPRKTFFSDRLPDEVFIVQFSEDGRVMNLKWANHSGWQWTSPVHQTYYRVGESSAVGALLRSRSSGSTTTTLLPPQLREALAESPAVEGGDSETPAKRADESVARVDPVKRSTGGPVVDVKRDGPPEE